MLPVQPVTWGTSNEELAAICVWARIRHGEQATLVMLQSESFIREIFRSTFIDAHGSCAVSVQEVPALDHEILDHSMEWSILVAHGAAIQPELTGA